MTQKLRNLSLSAKTLAACLIITLLIGYAVSLVQIYDRSHFNLKQTIQYYRGDEKGEDSLLVPQSFATMLSIAHVHTFSQPFIFGSIGLIFVFSGMTEKKKALLIMLGFLGSLISNLTPWLIRYTATGAVVLFPLSQIFIAVSLVIMSAVSLKEIWK